MERESESDRRREVPPARREMGRKFREQADGELRAAEALVRQFARIMWDRYKADLYLFGSRARRTAHRDSDHDIVAVAAAFREQPDLFRALDRRRLWVEAGGRGISLDLHCYTPEEFALELDSLGYLGEANEEGELLKIPRELSDAA